MRSFACITFFFVITTVAYLIWVLSETISMEFKIRYKPKTTLGNKISPELIENSELLFKTQEGLNRQANAFSKPYIDVHKLYEHLKDLLQENSDNEKISRNVTYRKLERQNENQTQTNEKLQEHNPLEVEKNYRQKDEQHHEKDNNQEKQEQQHVREENQEKHEEHQQVQENVQEKHEEHQQVQQNVQEKHEEQQQVQENVQEKHEKHQQVQHQQVQHQQVQHQQVERKDPEKSENEKELGNEQKLKKELYNQTFIKEETQNQNENKIQLKENQQMHNAQETERNESVLKHQIKNKCIDYKIFIWSIGRSGSTIMGSLFQNHPDAVYYYEPLHDLYRQHKWIFERLYGTENRSEILHAAISKIDEIFTESYSNKCNHIVIKELHPKFPGGLIRFSTSSRHHHIKFIHLIRDPRAALNSMLALRWFAKPDLPVVAEKLCKATLRDFKFGSMYMNKSRYLLIKYEKLCTNLTQFVELLLNFTQLKKRAIFNDYVTKLQQTNHKLPSDAYNTERNLTAPVFNWRKSIQMDVVNTVEKYCANMMNALDYKLVNDNMDMLRNLSIPLH